MSGRVRHLGAALVLLLAGLLLTPAAAHPGHGPSCFGLAATHEGTSGNDSITGTPGDDVIVTDGGNDIVFARGR